MALKSMPLRKIILEIFIMDNFKEYIKRFKIQLTSLSPNGYSSTLSFTELVDIEALGKSSSMIRFLGAKDFILNDKPLTEACKIASDLGQSVFPLIFRVGEAGYELLNFNEVKTRWEEYCNQTYANEMSEYVKAYIKSSSEIMKDKEIFLEAVMHGIFIQLMLFRDSQKELYVPNFPNQYTPLRWHLKKSLVESIPQVWYLKAQPFKKISYFIRGQGILEITKTHWGMLKDIHMEFRVEMSNEGYYRKMVDINLIE